MNANLASPAPLIARVEPLTRTRAVRGPFDYRLRPEQADVEVGALLRVPFGRQKTLGVVLELATESELALDRLAEPDAVLAREAVNLAIKRINMMDRKKKGNEDVRAD